MSAPTPVSGAVINITDEAQFDREVESAAKGSVLGISFWASWAEQCADMDALYADLAQSHGTLRFLRVEAEGVPEVSEAFEVEAVPSFVFIRDGEIVERVEGANAPLLTRTVKELSRRVALKLGPKASEEVVGGPVKRAAVEEKEELDVRLGKLIKRAPVMIFIKGTPSSPRCGFSRKLVGLLQEADVAFDYFDILGDEEVRQGLKTFSDWPTYPQAYVRGELMGGLDTVKEMMESGDFKEMLQAKE